jgi:hypothetical protein
MIRSIKPVATAVCLGAMAAFSLAPAADEAPSLRVMEAISIATEAYIYGYPLITFDTVCKQQTNVATSDAEHAPMGQMIKMRGVACTRFQTRPPQDLKVAIRGEHRSVL